MKNKLRAIWKIICSYEYFLISSEGVCASYKEKDHHSLIKTFTDTTSKVMKLTNEEADKILREQP